MTSTEAPFDLLFSELGLVESPTGPVFGFFGERLCGRVTDVRPDLRDQDTLRNGPIVLSAAEFGRMEAVVAAGRQPLRATAAARLDALPIG